MKFRAISGVRIGKAQSGLHVFSHEGHIHFGRQIHIRLFLRLGAGIDHAHAARQITAGSAPLLDADRDKPTVIALRELAAGKIGIEMLNKITPPQT